MNITEIIFSALGTIVTALVSWGIGALIAFLNKKVKNEKIKAIINNIGDVVEEAVKETYQIYVEALKEEGKFDLEAQKNALNRSVVAIKRKLSDEEKEFIKEYKGDVTEYIKTRVESTIYDLKKQ